MAQKRQFLPLALFGAHFGVLEEKELLAKEVELDPGLEFGDLAGDFEDFAESETVVLHAHSGLEVRHRGRHEVGVCREQGVVGGRRRRHSGRRN